MIDSLETKEKVRDFEYIWDKVIVPEVERSKKNYSGLFSQDYKLECAIGDCSYRAELEKSFQELWDLLKKECYNDNVERRLDFRKISAVLVRALIENKAFSFDVDRMRKDLELQQNSCNDRVDFNNRLCKSFLINYSLAFYCGLRLLYLTTIERYSKIDEKLAIALLDNKSFIKYEMAKDESDTDGFYVNVIMGLARADFRGDKIDMMLLAMILYQYETYTISVLRAKG